MSLYDPGNVAINWALSTVAAMEAAPRLAIDAAIEAADHDPRSLIALRKELARTHPDTWQAIKYGRVRSLVRESLKTSNGNPASRIYAALSRQSNASHLQAILSVGERKRLCDFVQLMHSASRVKPLGPDGIHEANLKAIKSRCGGLLAHLRHTASSAKLLATVDGWLVPGAEQYVPDCLGLILSGDDWAVITMRELRKFSPGHWRWRVLFGALLSHS